MNYTTIEQSKKLLELGLNPESADMYYPWDFENGKLCEIPIAKNLGFLECWSLGALLNLMPDILFTKEKNMYYFGHPDSNHIEQNTSSIITAYSMICWLLENNYIEK